MNYAKLPAGPNDAGRGLLLTNLPAAISPLALGADAPPDGLGDGPYPESAATGVALPLRNRPATSETTPVTRAAPVALETTGPAYPLDAACGRLLT